MTLLSGVVRADIASFVPESGRWEAMAVRFLRSGDPLALAYVETDRAGECRGGTEAYRRGNTLVSCKPLPTDRTVRWYIWETQALDYHNDRTCRREEAGCAKPIVYVAREMTQLRGRSRFTPDELRPWLSEGTHRLYAATEPLPDARMQTNQRPPGVEIVVRKDDSYTGYVSELRGVPFVLLPVTTGTGEHQTDARLGADCVALVIYGQRRLGRNVPYMAPPALKRFMTPVRQPVDDSRAVRRGDVLHFGFQTAVVYDDRPPRGVLNNDDLVIHTYHGRAEVVRFGALPYRHMEFEVYRWPE